MTQTKRLSRRRSWTRSAFGHGFKSREVVLRRKIWDELGPAPCPVCRYSVVARMRASGPYFFCLCAERKRS